MSIALALHVGRFIVLGTDTRVTCYARNNFETILRSDDTGNKLRKTPFGLITGTGDFALLDSVMTRAQAATGTRDALGIIAKEQARVMARPRMSMENRQYCVDSTGWILTYPGPNDTVRAAFYHQKRSRALWENDPSRDGHRFWPIEAGNGVIWLPDCDETVPVDDTLTNRLRTELRVCREGEPLEESIEHHGQLLRWGLAEAAKRITTIGPLCRIGVHTAAGQIAVGPEHYSAGS